MASTMSVSDESPCILFGETYFLLIIFKCTVTSYSLVPVILPTSISRYLLIAHTNTNHIREQAFVITQIMPGSPVITANTAYVAVTH